MLIMLIYRLNSFEVIDVYRCYVNYGLWVVVRYNCRIEKFFEIIRREVNV